MSKFLKHIDELLGSSEAGVDRNAVSEWTRLVIDLVTLKFDSLSFRHSISKIAQEIVPPVTDDSSGEYEPWNQPASCAESVLDVYLENGASSSAKIPENPWVALLYQSVVPIALSLHWELRCCLETENLIRST